METAINNLANSIPASISASLPYAPNSGPGTTNHCNHVPQNSKSKISTANDSSSMGFVVVVKNIQNPQPYKNPANIRNIILSAYPRLRVIKVSLTARGLVFNKVLNKEDQSRLLNNWNSDLFGGNTVAVPSTPARNLGHNIVIKDVPTSLIESEMLNKIKASHTSASLSMDKL